MNKGEYLAFREKGLDRKNNDTGELVAIIFVFAYVFDEVVNAIIGSNFSGALILLIFGALSFLHRRQNQLVIRNTWIGLYLLLATVSFVAFMSPLGCSAEIKGLVSLILTGMLVIFFKQISPIRLITNAVISNWILFLISALLVMDLMGVGVRTILFGISKGSGPYSEPSHLALYLVPIIAYRLVVSLRDSLAWIALGLSFLLSASSTLLIGVLGMLGLRFLNGNSERKARSWFPYFLFIAIFLALIFSNAIDLTNTTNRLENIFIGYQADKADHTNFSSLVWLNGWSQAYQTLNETYWLGTGINQMGCGRFYESGAFSALFFETSGVVLNANDGSLLAAKLIAEFGVLGIVSVLILSVLAFKAIFHLVKIKREDDDSHARVIRAVGGFCLLSYMFIRGAGYFQLPLILSIAMLAATLPKKHSPL